VSGFTRYERYWGKVKLPGAGRYGATFRCTLTEWPRSGPVAAGETQRDSPPRSSYAARDNPVRRLLRGVGHEPVAAAGCEIMVGATGREIAWSGYCPVG
jgi:hypothetical protein